MVNKSRRTARGPWTCTPSALVARPWATIACEMVLHPIRIFRSFVRSQAEAEHDGADCYLVDCAATLRELRPGAGQ